MPTNKPYDSLQSVIQTNHAGKLLNFDESLERLAKGLKFSLMEMEEGEFNGMPIKDFSQVGEYAQIALRPVLGASAAVLNCATTSGGWTTQLFIDSEDRDRLGGTVVVDLVSAEQKLTETINGWLASVAQNPHIENPALPLAANSEARSEEIPQIDRLSDVNHLSSSGWQPMPFRRTDEAASPTVSQAPATPSPSLS